MAEWTQDQIEEYAKGVLELFDDGFQFSDLFQIIPKVMEIVAAVKDTTGPEKKLLAIMLGEYLIDETDIWGPDALIDPILKKILPHAIQMAWDCYAQKYLFEAEEGEEGDTQ